MSVKTTKRKVVVNSDWTEAGDLANEIGKIYMQDLNSAIDDAKSLKAHFNNNKLFFIVQTEKDPLNLQNIEIRIGITDKLFNKLFESTDFWEYDYKSNKLNLLWSVPSRIDMKNFLRSPEKYSKEIIGWIRQYLKENPDINLNDKRSVILK